MTGEQAKAIRAVALVVMAIGLAIGFWHIHVAALNGSEDCGSPFQASTYETDGTGSLIVGECDSARQSRLLWAAILIGVGVAAVAVAQNRVEPLARVRSPFDDPSLTFNPPPGWPAMPAGFRPDRSWRPDPSWPAAPSDWQWWVRSEPPLTPH